MFKSYKFFIFSFCLEVPERENLTSDIHSRRGKCATHGIPYTHTLLTKMKTMATTRIMITVGDIGVPREAGIILKRIYITYICIKYNINEDKTILRVTTTKKK